jgi:hypothetical protein
MSALAAIPTLNGLPRLLGDLPRELTESTSEANLRLISVLARPESLLSIIDDALGVPETLGRIAAGSYRHVNHFDKIVLVDSDKESDYRLTLHMWKPPYTEAEVTDELIHDHRFNFWSAVLTGTLRSETFRKSDTGPRYRQYQYVPERQTKTNFYEYVGEASLESNGLAAKPAGRAYHLFHETIHRVQLPLIEMTCTLVLRGPRQRHHSNIFNTTYPKSATRLANRPFTSDQLAAKLTALAAALS